MLTGSDFDISGILDTITNAFATMPEALKSIFSGIELPDFGAIGEIADWVTNLISSISF